MRLSRPTLLLVDDDQPSRGILADCFKQKDWLVLEAGTARDALTTLSTHSVDVILSDFRMPGDNGLEFFQKVREHYSDLPFFLMTGTPELVGTPPPTLNGLFVKPLPPPEALLATISGALRLAA